MREETWIGISGWSPFTLVLLRVWLQMGPGGMRATLLMPTILSPARVLYILQLWDLVSEPWTNQGQGRLNRHLFFLGKQPQMPLPLAQPRVGTSQHLPQPEPQRLQAHPGSHLPINSWSNLSPLHYILIIPSPGFLSAFLSFP